MGGYWLTFWLYELTELSALHLLNEHATPIKIGRVPS